jgi:hypothetical protein
MDMMHLKFSSSECLRSGLLNILCKALHANADHERAAAMRHP